MSEKFSRADFYCLLMTLIWGANMSIAKDAMVEMTPLSFNGVRLMLATLLLWFLTLLKEGQIRLRRQDVRIILILGVVGNTAYQLLFIYGLYYTKAGNVGLLLASATILTAILSRMLGHEKLSPIVWIGIGVSLSGVGCILWESAEIGFSSGTLPGDLMILAAAACWSVYTVYSKSIMDQYTPLSLTTLTVAVGGFFFFLWSIPDILGQQWDAVSPKGYAELGFSLTFAIALGYAIWFDAIDKLGSTRTAIYGNLIPFSSLLFAAFFLNEPVTLFQAAGGGLILTGIYLTRLGRARGAAVARLGGRDSRLGA